MAINFTSGPPVVRLSNTAARSAQRTRLCGPAGEAAFAPHRAPGSDKRVRQAQLLAILRAQVSLDGLGAGEHASQTILEGVFDDWSASVPRSPLFWADAPAEVLAAGQDGGRDMMTSLFAFYLR